MRWGWAAAIALGAYAIGRAHGQHALMEILRKLPPGNPIETVTLSDDEERAIIDMVKTPGGAFEAGDT